MAQKNRNRKTVPPKPLPEPSVEIVHPKPLQSLIASARRITTKRLKERQQTRPKATGLDADWQADAWDMYDLVGEQRFLINTLAERLGKARLYLGKLDPTNITADPAELKDEPLVEILESFGDNPAGRQQLLEKMGQQLGVAGEGWILGVPREILSLSDESDLYDEDYEEPSEVDQMLGQLWYARSVEEVTFTQEGTVVFGVPEVEGDITVDADSITLIRVWRAHPRNWARADSATKASLPVLKELAGLTSLVSAQTTSRLAGNGILLVPLSAKTHMQAAAGKNPNDIAEEDEFTEALIEAMITPINDRGSASAVVPLVATVPDESVDKFRHISFATALDAEARELRDEAIRRLALGQDAPPELLLGTGGMNHWGGWLVKEETVSVHIEPNLALVCDSLTTQWLWPTLIDLYDMDPSEAAEYVIWYDVSHMIVRPNLGADAMELHARGVISDRALREVLGFEEENDITSEDLVPMDPVVQKALELATAAPSLVQSPGLPALVEQIRSLSRAAEDAQEIPTIPTETPEERPTGELPETSNEGPDLEGSEEAVSGPPN